MSTFKVSAPPDNLSAINAVEIIGRASKGTEERYLIRSLDEVDQFIKDLLAARNKVWPWPPIRLEVNP